MSNKLKILIFSLIILLIIISVLAYFFVQKKQIINIEETPVVYDEDYYKDSIPVYGEDELNYRKALLSQTIDDCFALKESKIDNCISSIAVSSQNEEFCKEITDERTREECPKFVVLEKAIVNDDESFCEEIDDLEFNKLCYNSVFKNNFEEDRCFNLKGDLKDSCLDNYYYNYAYEKINVSFCDKIKDEAISDECKQTISGLPVDTDGDGLVDFLEMNYGTDPFKPDTDGDGFSDWLEIKNGYNPLVK